MKILEWTFKDKTTWDEGPWQDEADKRQWLDPGTNYPCLIVRGPSGALCGYVGVSKDHPLFEKDYYDIDNDIEVHSGLTYSDFCQEDKDGICHIVESGEDDRVWWFGFDCAHCYDISPAFISQYNFKKSPSEVYRKFDYVTRHVTNLAKQLKELA